MHSSAMMTASATGTLLLALALASAAEGADPGYTLQSLMSRVASHYANATAATAAASSACAGLGEEEQGRTCQAVELCYRQEKGLAETPAASLPEIQLLCQAMNLNVGGGAHPDPGPSPGRKPSSASVWGYGILAVTVISAMSVMGVGVLPFMSKSFYSSLLTALIGLAVGSLSGSALFHLIPSAFGLADVPAFAHHSYLDVSLVVWGGVYMFFVIERMLKMFMDAKSRRQGGGRGPHGHSHGGGKRASVTNGRAAAAGGPASPESKDPILAKVAEEEAAGDGEVAVRQGGGACVAMGSEEVYEQSKPAMRASFGHMERPAYADNRPTVDSVSRSLESSQSPIATVAWMIIFGDGVHNFIDGLSIGAAFSESLLTGISVSLAVLCEEFPHELGDFAVLLNAGMSMRQAMCYNFLSACTCYLGLVLGILLGELEMANQYVFALAGGMFLYIALVDMVPELNETVDEASRDPADGGGGAAAGGFRRGLWVFLLQNVGILVGIASLFFLAKFQDDIQINL